MKVVDYLLPALFIGTFSCFIIGQIMDLVKWMYLKKHGRRSTGEVLSIEKVYGVENSVTYNLKIRFSTFEEHLVEETYTDDNTTVYYTGAAIPIIYYDKNPNCFIVPDKSISYLFYRVLLFFILVSILLNFILMIL